MPKLSGDAWLTLAAGAVVGLLVVVAVRRLQGAAASLADLPGAAWGAVTGAAGAVADAVQGGILDARQAIADSNPANPGAGLAPGWYRVQTRWGEVVTRHPDGFKTINPYDTLGLINP